MRDEQSRISLKRLKIWLILAICPPNVGDPIRGAGQHCGSRHHLRCPNTLCFSYSAESMLQLKPPGCNCSSRGVGGHSSTFVVSAVRPGSNMQQKAGRAVRGCGHLVRVQTLESVHALLSPSNILMLLSQVSQQEHLHAKTSAEQRTTLLRFSRTASNGHSFSCLSSMVLLHVKHQNIFSQPTN